MLSGAPHRRLSAVVSLPAAGKTSAEVGDSSDTRPVCAWCGAPIDPAANPQPGARRVACELCGAQTTWPAPTDAELATAYEGWYRPEGGRFSGPMDRLLGRLRGRLAGRIDSIAPPGPVLDVGSGNGELLDALTASGRAAVGLERVSQREDVLDSELVDVDLESAAVVFWHSLEHLRDAGAAVDHAAHLLEPRGVLVIAMPNPASVQAHAFGDRWLALDLPRHLVHVPAPALLARLRATGLDVERVSYLRGGQVVFGWLHGLIGLLPGSPDLYDAIRRPAARRAPMSGSRRAGVLAAAVVAMPVAAAAALVEAALRRGGSVYVEARRV
jgi:SAM-dependent methyltransferase